MKCLDVVKEDMQEVEAREDEVFGGKRKVFDRSAWRIDLLIDCLFATTTTTIIGDQNDSIHGIESIVINL